MDRLHERGLGVPDRGDEETFPLEELYEACRVARGILTGPHAVGRVIARPFLGEPGNYRAPRIATTSR